MQSSLENFTVSQKYQSYDLNSAILLDEERKKVCFLFANIDTSEIYSYKEILETEIVEDGKTITGTSRSSQIGGAIIGGVLAGGAGAVIGGLGGKKTSEQEINKIDLKVIVNNTKSPVKYINFLTADEIDIDGKPFPIKKDNPKYKSAMSSINHWHSLLSLLIKETEPINLVKPLEEQVSVPKNLSIADELKKLSELLSQGILTEEEFNKQKQKLLSS
ncbi:SHOCT domain-containing protein [Cytobacillus oceanisediminis]|nr:SHOCT domain-containing protein [Cytobacillus oceanisediminis]